MAPLWDSRPSPGKGNGMMALEDIEPGNLILEDKEALRIYAPSTHIAAADVRAAFDRLSAEDRARFLLLSDGQKTSDDYDNARLLRIFETNNFEDQYGCWIYLLICRCNHSCQPNAVVLISEQGEQLYAETFIPKGSEIYISYKGAIFRSLTARRRQAMMRSHKGFTCSCPACSMPNPGLMVSDMRRTLIGGLWYALQGLEVPDLSLLDDPIAVIPNDYDPIATARHRQVRLSEAERTAYYYVLARLEQAEGSSPYWTAAYLREAATYLLYQIADPPHVVLPRSAQYVRDWMKEASMLTDSVRPPHSQEVKSMHQQCNNIEAALAKLADESQAGLD
ncbi:hypothetical protein LTR56_021295 [Elasticomyces elasticus]|nr:hypothetical protein LTR56_021295 [Elasticomyces elasticus]KAK3662159.1 hypothetical protein LTR22_006924 [Elasticomyces elasticus]KAK4916137.1 hypothetical protein LTR49_015778 [Elasticomyces elasticus]KAK5767923.1 hypothetical protein LTS12_001740 [Elasticomyces elasticus]